MDWNQVARTSESRFLWRGSPPVGCNASNCHVRFSRGGSETSPRFTSSRQAQAQAQSAKSFRRTSPVARRHNTLGLTKITGLSSAVTLVIDS
jgi:hypothetical protein